MSRDQLDDVLAQWRETLPDDNAQPMAVVGRILRLAGLLERRANEALKPFDLPIWGFDVLGTLLRHGPPYAMSPTHLLQSMMLTSGAMTNRINRLEELGYVSRKPDPHDRRSQQVVLTARGKRLIEKAAPIRFQEAEDALRGIPAAERKHLAALLKQLVLELDR